MAGRLSPTRGNEPRESHGSHCGARARTPLDFTQAVISGILVQKIILVLVII